jgi:hypothetical protein
MRPLVASSFRNFLGALFCFSPSEPASLSDIVSDLRLKKNLTLRFLFA